MYYRRDISSTLTVLTAMLAVFLGYQLWVKPAPQPTGLAHPGSEVPENPQPLSIPSSPESLNAAPTDVPTSRLVELGEAPDQALGDIRDEFEKANYGETEQRLKALTKRTITQAPAQRYVSGLWNNLGIQQEKLSGTARSVNAFKQAVSWDPSSVLAHLNLTQAYWELRDPAMTPRFLDSVIRLAPDDPFPHLALADVLLAQGKGSLATPHLEQVQSRVTRDPNLKAYWQKLSKKAQLNKQGERRERLSHDASASAQPQPSAPSEPAQVPSPSANDSAEASAPSH